MKFVESFSNSDIWLDSKGKSDFLGWFVGVGGGWLAEGEIRKVVAGNHRKLFGVQSGVIGNGSFWIFSVYGKDSIVESGGKIETQDACRILADDVESM